MMIWRWKRRLASCGYADYASGGGSNCLVGSVSELQIARALAQQPRVLLLDEPTNHLDIQHQLELMRLISQLPLTVVVALHDLNLAANYCQRLILLKAGRIAATGAPAEVLTLKISSKPGASKRTSTGQTPG